MFTFNLANGLVVQNVNLVSYLVSVELNDLLPRARGPNDDEGVVAGAHHTVKQVVVQHAVHFGVV